MEASHLGQSLLPVVAMDAARSVEIYLAPRSAYHRRAPADLRGRFTGTHQPRQLFRLPEMPLPG